MLRERGIAQLSLPLLMLLVRGCRQKILQHMCKKKVKRRRNWLPVKLSGL
uniref:Uncharacterized protein n=1 Tax=Lotus japonicus TaxID=34305 RepID=I3S1C6_LOTJA|nr:unknown [Lotus japonicus]